MPDTRPEPGLTPAMVPSTPAETDWDGGEDIPAAAGLTANRVDGAAIQRSGARSPLPILVVLALALLVVVLGLAVLVSPFRTAPASSGTQAAAPSGATSAQTEPSAPAGAPGTTIIDAGKTRIEDVLVSGGCKISPSCPASVVATTITHGIQISAGTPAVLRLDGRYDVLRAALYVDNNSTPVGILKMVDVSDPDLPKPAGAFQFSHPTSPGAADQEGYFQLPIPQHAQQISLSVDAGTVDLIGYVEVSGS